MVETQLQICGERSSSWWVAVTTRQVALLVSPPGREVKSEEFAIRIGPSRCGGEHQGWRQNGRNKSAIVPAARLTLRVFLASVVRRPTRRCSGSSEAH